MIAKLNWTKYCGASFPGFMKEREREGEKVSE